MTKKKSSKTLPVIVRFEAEGRKNGPGWHLHDLVAIFPTEPGTNSPSSMACYSPGEGHASCEAGYIARTKVATKEQAEAMLSELRRRGYGPMRVVARTSSAHRAARLAALRR